MLSVGAEGWDSGREIVAFMDEVLFGIYQICQCPALHALHLRGTDCSSRQVCAGCCLQHHGIDREKTVVKAHLFLGFTIPLCAVFPSESSFLWHIYRIIES